MDFGGIVSVQNQSSEGVLQKRSDQNTAFARFRRKYLRWSPILLKLRD